MAIRSLMQALSEPEIREALTLGLVELLGGASISIARSRQNLIEPGDHQRAENISKGCGGASLASSSEPLVSNQLALQLFRALDHEMKSFVGLGSDDAVLLMDRAGGVHGSNRAARKLAEARFFVASASGGLALAERAHEKVFRAAFRQFCLDWPEEMRVLIDNHTLLVLRPGVESSAVVALVAVTIRQIQKRFVVPLDKLQAVLEVSPKQAEVAQAVMRGLGPVEYAQETGCSVKTARFHLYGLMRKVGCHSQIELGNFLSRTFG